MKVRLDATEIGALRKAGEWLFHSEFCPYLELKQLCGSAKKTDQIRFKHLFGKFYGFKQLRLQGQKKDSFEQTYFRMLKEKETKFPVILESISTITDNLQFSLASKLVATNDESSPIIDRHVAKFFGLRLPANTLTPERRIEEFVEILNCIRQSYDAWTNDHDLSAVLASVKEKHRQLENCHPNRVWDFLVWNVGNKRFLIRD